MVLPDSKKDVSISTPTVYSLTPTKFRFHRELQKDVSIYTYIAQKGKSQKLDVLTFPDRLTRCSRHAFCDRYASYLFGLLVQREP
jgi:hypothetical protein